MKFISIVKNNEWMVFKETASFYCGNHTAHLTRVTWKNYIFIYNHVYVYTNHVYLYTNHVYVYTNHVFVYTNHVYVYTNH
jgi:hypothetical protein